MFPILIDGTVGAFRGKCQHIDTTDRAAWAAHLKDAHKARNVNGENSALVSRASGVWRAPSRKAFEPGQAITPGAEVMVDYVVPAFDGHGHYTNVGSLFRGQVWSEANPATHGRAYGRQWWVVTSDGKAYCIAERDLIVIGQCSEDIPLFDEDVA